MPSTSLPSSSSTVYGPANIMNVSFRDEEMLPNRGTEAKHHTIPKKIVSQFSQLVNELITCWNFWFCRHYDDKIKLFFI